MAQLTQASRQIQGFDLVSLPATEGVLRSKMSLQIWRVVSVLETAHAEAAATAAQAQAEARGLHDERERLLDSNVKLEKDCSTAIDANQMLQVSIRLRCLPPLRFALPPHSLKGHGGRHMSKSRSERASVVRFPSGWFSSAAVARDIAACAALRRVQLCSVCSACSVAFAARSAQREHWLRGLGTDSHRRTCLLIPSASVGGARVSERGAGACCTVFGGVQAAKEEMGARMRGLADQLAAALALNTQQTSTLDGMTAKAAQLEAAAAKTAPELSKANSVVGQLTEENRDLQLAARKLELRAQVHIYARPSATLPHCAAEYTLHIGKLHGGVGG
jgi:hypothetical protein